MFQHSMNTILTIIVAAGSGNRMGSAIPKQLLELDGKPIVMQTIDRMAAAVGEWIVNVDAELLKSCGLLITPVETSDGVVDNVINTATFDVDNCVNNSVQRFGLVHKIVVVLPPDRIDEWQQLCHRYNFTTPHLTVGGGQTRFHSVGHGLGVEPEAALVLVHDGVRPLVSNGVVAEALSAAARCGAAVPVVELTDSLREIVGEEPRNGDDKLTRAADNGSVDGCAKAGPESRAVERARFRAVQTPQVFRGDLLRKAYAAPYCSTFTDDASVVEHAGFAVCLTAGHPNNIKITTPIDLVIARELMRG